MDEISNKTLAFLLIGAIVISLGGTLISMNKLADLGAATGLIASDKTNGTVTLTVNTSIAINVTDDAINLGNLDFSETGDSETAADYFVVENIGSVDIDLNAWDSGTMYGNGTGGFWPQATDNPSGGCMDDAVNGCYRIRCNNTEGSDLGDCDQTAYTAMGTQAAQIDLADDLNWEDDNTDSVRVYVEVTVPTGVQAGAKSSVVRFEAASSATP